LLRVPTPKNFPLLLFVPILTDEDDGTSVDMTVTPLDEMTQCSIRLYPHH
jgi:hypothetical protein